MTTTKNRWQPKIGLALGGGAARGWAHIGVLKTLEKHGIVPDIVTGTSVGAIVAGFYLTGQLKDLEKWVRSLNRLKLMSYMDFRIRSPGLIGGNRIFSLIQKSLGDIAIEDLPKPFIGITTDMVTGHEIWLRKGPLLEALRASSALPGILPPVLLNGRWCIDGALVNPVPVSPCLALESQMTISVNLNADILGKALGPNSNIPTITGFDMLDELGRDTAKDRTKKVGRLSSIKRIFRRNPNNPSLFGVMVSALHIAQERLARSRLAGDPPDVDVEPEIGHIGLLEFERGEELIALGEKAAKAALPKIKKHLSIYNALRVRD